MICFLGLVSGVVNGMFAAGAGQLLVFVLVFILKKESHSSRNTSLVCMTCATVVSFVCYLQFVKVDLIKCFIIICSGVIFGFLGAYVVKKIKSKWLNLISGLLVFAMALLNLIKG